MRSAPLAQRLLRVRGESHPLADCVDQVLDVLGERQALDAGGGQEHERHEGERDLVAP
jgi:hypothetical protein